MQTKYKRLWRKKKEPITKYNEEKTVKKNPKKADKKTRKLVEEAKLKLKCLYWLITCKW